MATLPFIGPVPRPRQPLTGSRLVIVASAAAFFLFLIWAAIAPVDEVTRGQGRVIPSSKVQVIQAAAPATLSELLVRGGAAVRPFG
jgi:adhesin transport system membrane fusion protein